MEQGIHGKDPEQKGLFITREMPESLEGSGLGPLSKTWSENAQMLKRFLYRNRANTTLGTSVEIV